MKNSNIPTYPALLDEEPIPLKVAGERFPYPVGKKAIDNYWRHGVRGIRLETVLIGSRRFTSEAGIRRFLEATNKTPGEGEVIRPMSERELQAAKAETGIR